MRSFRKLAVTTLVFLLCVDGFAAEKAAEKGKKSAQRKPEQKESGASKEPEKLAFPVPVGHDSKGLKLPSFDADGKLKMLFNIGTATRINDKDVKMSDLQVQTYGEDGAPELSMDLPVSMFDLSTRVITARQKVKITREDFEITGNQMEFNTETRTGKLGGGVRMIIFNLDTTAGSEGADAKPEREAKIPAVTFPATNDQPTIKVTKPTKPSPPEAAPRE